MGLDKQFQPASFKGVPFLVESEDENAGKKTATHEFVNSNKRFTEDLGELPPTFVINAVIHGSDAIQQRLNLKRVLNEPGLGELVHPVYGSVQVKSTTYSISSNQTNIGQFRFSINFETSEANVTISPEITTASAVTKAAEDARVSVDDALEENYIVPRTPDPLQAVGDKVNEIYDNVFESVDSAVGSEQDKVATFTRVVSEGKSKVFSVIQQGSELKAALQDLYLSALSVTTEPQTLLEQWESLLDFGFIDITADVTTVPRLNRENDLSVTNEHTRLSSLINLIEAAAYTNFETDVELDAVLKVIDDSFERLMEDYDQDIDSDNVKVLAEDSSVRTNMAILRVTNRKVFNQKEQSAWRVVDIEPGFSSMALTAYQYFGGIDQLALIESLNPEVNYASFDQQIKAVSR